MVEKISYKITIFFSASPSIKGTVWNLEKRNAPGIMQVASQL